ncbi:MAG: hypothetical protein HKN73_15605 [Gemmatimonadetes bacterium]|nr:hypothetical protein [Gemmatimonadota bacterium]
MYDAREWGKVTGVGLLTLTLAWPGSLSGQDSVQVADTTPPPPAFLDVVGAGDAAEVIALLQEGADPNQPDASGDVAVGRHLQRFGDPLGMAHVLLDAGADPNRANASGTTPLMFASQWAPPDVVQLLLDRGADPNLGDGVGDVPLGAYIASHYDPVTIARLLLVAGADPTRPNASGVTPRMYAQHWGSPELVRLLGGG